MTKPVQVVCKEIDGNFYVVERTPDMIVPRTVLCCGSCLKQSVSIDMTHFADFNLTHCENCGEEIDWEAHRADLEAKNKAFSDWFNENSTDGSLSMINEEGIGYLQEGWAK